MTTKTRAYPMSTAQNIIATMVEVTGASAIYPDVRIVTDEAMGHEIKSPKFIPKYAEVYTTADGLFIKAVAKKRMYDISTFIAGEQGFKMERTYVVRGHGMPKWLSRAVNEITYSRMALSAMMEKRRYQIIDMIRTHGLHREKSFAGYSRASKEELVYALIYSLYDSAYNKDVRLFDGIIQKVIAEAPPIKKYQEEQE